ncbi:MAG: TonB-dependent receptor [Gemmatimonadetes bacterium]|nr:TonB-dependent receptor [Gemmatimonadota bacterium]MYK42344.1 TonB-dependent receptor [Gemmatimonadota bacterium]
MSKMAKLMCLWATLGCGVAWAQSDGFIEGTVTEEAGESLPGANIAVRLPTAAYKAGTTADSDGQFRIAVPAGNYQVEITFVGYKSDLRENVQVRAGQTTRLDVVLVEQVIFLAQSVVSASRRQEKILDAPASVSVVEGSEIHNNPALSLSDHVKNLPAVDIAKRGLANANVVVRGFNNIFSGTLLTLTDNRIARVPSLRVNALNFIPLTNDDVERIEVVLGPGSALYGPNSADGVMHIITHSPFTSQGTNVHVGMGERDLRHTTVRHAGVVGDRLGYKISGQHYTGTEWEYTDPEEVKAQALRQAEIDAGADLPLLKTRDPNNRNQGIEARLDWRAADDLTAILAAGHNKANIIGGTGVGASQTIDWQYNYAQLRLLYRDWFLQAFRNWNDAGDTYLLRTGDPVVDISSLTVFQAQHTSGLGQRQRFTYGLDALLTRPDTDGTIMGSNEADDDLNEYGGYVQSETALSDMLDLVLALRYDYHNHLEEPELSPRAALVFKPQVTQTLRLTYNRAFSTPTANNLFLDLQTARDPFGLSPNFSPLFAALGLGEFKSIDGWTQGNYRSPGYGFTFRRDEEGRPLFRSPFAPMAGLPADQYLPLDDPLFTNVMWGIGRQAVLAQFGPAFQELATGALMAQGMEAEDAQATAGQLAAALPGIVPEQLPGLRNVMGRLNIETEPLGAAPDPNRPSFFFVEADGITPITAYDVPRIHSAITQTIELGYKGVVADKWVVAADLYQSRIEDFVGSVSVETPNIFLDPQSLGAALGESIGAALSDSANVQLAGALAALDVAQEPGVVQGNNNGSPVDELTGILTAGAAAIPYGTVSPEQASDPYAMIMSYRNFKDVTIRGLDLSLAYFPADHWRLTGNYSYVNENLFENLQYSYGEGRADIALNAPRHKVKLGMDYNFAEWGLALGGQVRYIDSFPMNSGVYVGEVDSYTVLDLNLTYRLPLEQDLVLQVDASNALNQAYQSFVGAPAVGRLVFGQVGLRF